MATIQRDLSNSYDSVDKCQRLVRERDDVELEYRRLQSVIKSEHPQYASLTQPGAVDLTTVQCMLDDDTAVLEYLLGEKQSYVWVITNQSCHMASLPAQEQINLQVQTLFEKTGNEFFQESHKLYSLLLGPLDECSLRECSGNRVPNWPLRLVVIPDGNLHWLPFELLVQDLPERLDTPPPISQAPSSASKIQATRNVLRDVGAVAEDTRSPCWDATGITFLLKRCATVYAPSATALIELRKRQTVDWTHTDRVIPRAQKAFVGLAPVSFRGAAPLPGSEREVTKIASLFPANQATVLRRSAARKEAVQTVGVYRYVHFSTHGITHRKKPQYCGILLADDILHTFEIMNLSLEADLVTISACESGIGKPAAGEGFIGLTRAFFYAGARSLCVTLWPVGDEPSANLMERFYHYLVKEDLDKATALQRAKVDMIEQSGSSSFLDWAAFVLVGDWQ